MKKFLDELKERFRQWWPEVEPAAVAVGLALILSLTGCTGIMAMNNAVDQGKDLTPEQIKAYKDMGLDVYKCFTLAGGPPVMGKIVSIIVPKNTKPPIKFGENCQVLQG